MIDAIDREPGLRARPGVASGAGTGATANSTGTSVAAARSVRIVALCWSATRNSTGRHRRILTASASGSPGERATIGSGLIGPLKALQLADPRTVADPTAGTEAAAAVGRAFFSVEVEPGAVHCRRCHLARTAARAAGRRRTLASLWLDLAAVAAGSCAAGATRRAEICRLQRFQTKVG